MISKSMLSVTVATFSLGILVVASSFAEGEVAPKAVSPTPKVVASDINHDGKPDQWQYYDDKGQLIRTEADTNNDGKVDEIGYFSNGKVAKVEKDSDYDGEMDRWIDY